MHGIKTNKWGDYAVVGKVNIDLMQIFKMRAGAMKIDKGMLGDLLMSYSLDFISQTIGIVKDDGKIKDFDYMLLNKDSWSKEEKENIKKYTLKDIEVTKKMYDWLENYFEGFKPFLKEEDNKKKDYLTIPISVFAYKSICKAMGWKEEYAKKNHHTSYGGGYVAYPAGEHFTGNIYCLDFNSLYPSIMHQCNIYSPIQTGDISLEPGAISTVKFWNGNNKFDVEGIYNAEEQGKIEKLLKKWYEQRLIWKKEKDPREYSIKIIINTIYGLLGNEAFKHIANPVSAGDVTRIGRQWVKLARTRFKEAGYEVIYTDTDSVYIIDKLNNKDKMLDAKNKIIREIKENVPFPYEHFDMGIDDEISDMWFFKGGTKDKDTDDEMDEMDFENKPKGFMKKNYIYRTINGKVKVKNLGVRKKSTSALTRKIFWEYLIPKISQERKVKFPKKYFVEVIDEILKKDIKTAAKRFQVAPLETYKLDGQLQAQIAKLYGPGIHFLIRNKKIGIGKGVKYCTIDEFISNKLTTKDLVLTGIWKELAYFIDGNIEEEKYSQSTALTEWF